MDAHSGCLVYVHGKEMHDGNTVKTRCRCSSMVTSKEDETYTQIGLGCS